MAMGFGDSITFADDDIRRAIGGVASEGSREDRAFVEALKAGDAAAFDTLVDRFSGDIYALLYRLTSDPEEARDLSQDTFLRALRSIAGFRGDASLKTWLFRIAINESRNRFRWWKRRRRDATVSLDVSLGATEMTLHDTLADRSETPEESALAREREAKLGEALAGLKDIYREAIVLCDIEGLSYEETATALGTNIGTVKSRISRGREELRRRLKDL
ncbi:MAG TPA: sigma-70 family RNA polymerase sigma factor [Pyrinomonadaceae bacterium]|jgi:RNA polymerase sigma-70 factor (ECF subfamily)|nr:sigma-70 family RNA polymerase sigma factor [Pyrinomonadaceae bacterium]